MCIRDSLTEVHGGVERLDLLHQPVDELLRGAYRNPWDIIDRLFRIELCALAPRVRERVDEVRADAEEPELEDLEQAAGTGSNHNHFREDGLALGSFDIQARPALASVGVWKYSLSEASCSTRRFSSAMRPSAVLIGMQS